MRETAAERGNRYIGGAVYVTAVLVTLWLMWG